MNMSKLDLNLLPVLIMLYKTRSLSITAKNLGKTTSAISKNLTKLRQELNDELFIRTQNGIKPTTFTINFIPKLEVIFDDLESSISPELFDPKTVSKKIVIASNQTILSRYGHLILKEINNTAANVSVELVNWRSSTYDDIDNGVIDVGIQFMNDDCAQTIYQQRLLDNEFFIVTRKDHPVNQLNELLLSDFIMFRSSGWNTHYYRLERIMQKEKLDLNVKFVSEELTSILQLVRDTDFVTILPEFIIDDNTFNKVALVKHNARFDVVTCISRTNKNSQLHQWITHIISQAIQVVA